MARYTGIYKGTLLSRLANIIYKLLAWFGFLSLLRTIADGGSVWQTLKLNTIDLLTEIFITIVTGS